jgi:uncharacterized protein with PIN domain
MRKVYLRFYEELNNFLPVEKRKATFEYFFENTKNVLDVLRDFRISENQVDLILANGASVGAGYFINEGDRISIYPVFESLDISSIQKVHTKPLREPRFILDVHLGKLANHLRMLGFDTLYKNNFTDIELVTLSIEEQRILLSKDRKLIEESGITRGYRIKEKDIRSQLIEVLERFDLYSTVNPFCRCIECNTLLEAIVKEQIIHRLPLKVKELFNDFLFCKMCDRIYWQGSHYIHMKKFIDDVLNRI